MGRFFCREGFFEAGKKSFFPGGKIVGIKNHDNNDKDQKPAPKIVEHQFSP